MITKKRTLKDWIIYLVIILIIAGGLFYHGYFFKPKNSLELYQELTFSDSFKEVQKLFLDGYERNFSREDFNYIQENTANSVGQFTLFEFNEKSYVIMTSRGTAKLKIHSVEELPEDIRKFFMELSS
ncbi:hypothetical protein V7127_22435 [Bacillus sp. JJ1773]|uniref:hypothetical protein n=1 Tax=Bacillus sp. JJ1773 TaxID=3122965 RepID=UPI002FFEFD22